MKKIISLLLSLVLLFTLVPTAFAASGRTYYIDSVNGSDSYSGTSQKKAWKTLSKASSVTFSAGDRILLKRGQTFDSLFVTNGNGTSKAPITVSSYGKGKLPKIVNTQNYPVLIIQLRFPA